MFKCIYMISFLILVKLKVSQNIVKMIAKSAKFRRHLQWESGAWRQEAGAGHGGQENNSQGTSDNSPLRGAQSTHALH